MSLVHAYSRIRFTLTRETVRARSWEGAAHPQPRRQEAPTHLEGACTKLTPFGRGVH